MQSVPLLGPIMQSGQLLGPIIIELPYSKSQLRNTYATSEERHRVIKGIEAAITEVHATGIVAKSNGLSFEQFLELEGSVRHRMVAEYCAKNIKFCLTIISNFFGIDIKKVYAIAYDIKFIQ